MSEVKGTASAKSLHWSLCGCLRRSMEAGLGGVESSEGRKVEQEVSRVPRGWGTDFGLNSEGMGTLLENSEQKSDKFRFML